MHSDIGYSGLKAVGGGQHPGEGDVMEHSLCLLSGGRAGFL